MVVVVGGNDRPRIDPIRGAIPSGDLFPRTERIVGASVISKDETTVRHGF
jgi:hypothetical protein